MPLRPKLSSRFDLVASAERELVLIRRLGAGDDLRQRRVLNARAEEGAVVAAGRSGFRAPPKSAIGVAGHGDAPEAVVRRSERDRRQAGDRVDMRRTWLP